MMPETVRAMSEGQSVRVTRLFQFEFASKTVRFWDGIGIFEAGGNEWEGAADVINVGGLEWAEGLAASQATFGLSGVSPDLILAARNSDLEVKDRPCSVYLQFLLDRFKPLDGPVAIWAGRMDRLTFRGTVSGQDITLQAETLFSERVRSTYGLMTNSDQQARWPGDDGLVGMPELVNKKTNWLKS